MFNFKNYKYILFNLDRNKRSKRCMLFVIIIYQANIIGNKFYFLLFLSNNFAK